MYLLSLFLQLTKFTASYAVSKPVPKTICPSRQCDHLARALPCHAGKKRHRDREAEHLKQIAAEKKRAEDLLHATLPAAAHELKSTNTVKPRRFEDVAVLFCDVVGFTAYRNKYPAETVVSQLQDLAIAFEETAVNRGQEKIKTIGNAFLATAGLMEHVEDPAVASVLAGLDMVEAVKSHASGWEVRVGIHMGPLVGGVVGKKNYSFDIWGNTVNIAARIIGVSDPDSGLVSTDVWRNLHDSFDGKSKGMVELKGKGSVELIECLCVR